MAELQAETARLKKALRQREQAGTGLQCQRFPITPQLPSTLRCRERR